MQQSVVPLQTKLDHEHEYDLTQALKMDDISKSLQNMQRYSLNPRISGRENREDSTGFTLPSQMNLNQISLDDPVESPMDIVGRIQTSDMREKKRSYAVISGGTAANDFVHAFGTDCAFILPGKSLLYDLQMTGRR